MVTKRDGRKTKFDKEKIIQAVEKAFTEVDGELDTYAKSKIQEIADSIEESIKDKKNVSVEEIQDMVENKLMNSKRKDVARAYIIYRNERTNARENTIDKVVSEIVTASNDYWNQENSNKDEKLATTQRDYLAGAVSADQTRRKLLPKDIVKAHDEGLIHFHDADYYLQKIHNCFYKNERFVTSDGVKAFNEFNDGQEVEVVDLHGVWRKATVHKYGKQKMNKVTFTSGRSSKSVICTANHRWVLADGSVTTNLTVGDKLYQLEDMRINIPVTYEQKKAFCIGFIIGDGVDHGNYTEARLCGNKTRFRQVFYDAGYSVNESYDNGDLSVRCKTSFKQDFLNGKAWKYMSKECKQYVMLGYYSADGATNCNKICTTDNRLAELIRDISGVSGMYIASETLEVRDTEYKKNSKLMAFRFRKHQTEKNCWIVNSIEPYSVSESEAWCVEEPITHTFTLDGGMVTGNCDLINLEDMLQNGTVISGKTIDKPHKFSTACTIATQIIAQVASSQYGGQSVSMAHLSPFINESYKTFKRKFPDFTEEQINQLVDMDISDGVQTIQYQITTLMTTNGQAPFITLYLNINEVEDGIERENLAKAIKEVLIQRIKGVKNEVGVWTSPAFPKIIYALDENNITENSPYWYLTELAAECTAKRMVPDYISNKIMREYKNGDVYTCMGCRSFLTPDRTTENYARAKNYDKYAGHKYWGRFNQGVVTINLVDVACSSNRDFDKFWEIFEERLELCHKALRCRHDRLLGTPSDIAPILWQNGALARLNKGEVIDELLYHGYSTISLGYAGLYECVKYMTGKSHTDEEAKPFALQVMQKMNDKCNEWKKAEDIDYSLYGTPMESTTYKFASCLKKRFGIIPDVTDHDYITNSYHVCVREKINAFAKLKFEAEFQKLSPGGAISYIEVPNMQHNIPAVLDIIKFIYENILYAELNTKSDYCHKCGYNGEILIKGKQGDPYWECPNCGNVDKNQMTIVRRTCGYLGEHYWNTGRTEEIRDRVLHVSNSVIKGGD